MINYTTWLIHFLIGSSFAAAPIRGEVRYNNYPLSTTKCGFDDNTIKNYAAVGPFNFNTSFACGQCVIVRNPETLQSVQVVIVDQCSGCSGTDIIVDKGSFGMIADIGRGFIMADWMLTPCSVRGNIEYDWVLPPSTNLIALRLNNLAVPILTVDVYVNGQYLNFHRLGYNLFGGILVGNPGTLVTLRLTSIFNEVLVEPRVMVGQNMRTIGTQQFSKARISQNTGEKIGSAFSVNHKKNSTSARYLKTSRISLSST